MESVVLCDPKFGAGPIQAAIDFLTVEKHYRVVGAALIAPGVPEGFSLDVPAVAGAEAASAVRRAAKEFKPRVVVDLTESALEERFAWANEALQLGLEVHGADFRLWPPVLKGGDVPTVTFVGAGPATGKTAAIVKFLEYVKDEYKSAAVVLDLGGPSYPEIVEPVDPASASARLLSYHRDGRGVGGDHFLIATATGVPAVGCSFAGTGFTGVPLNSLLGDAFVFAAEAGGELIVVEGSGLAMPPAAGPFCFFVNVKTEAALLRAFPFAYQLRRAVAVVATGFATRPPGRALEALRAEVESANPRALFTYAKLEAKAVGAPELSAAVVVSARPEGERAALAGYWRRETRAHIREVIGAEEFPPRAATAKSFRKSAGAAGLLLDMAARNLGEWLTWADSWDVPVYPTCETLTPEEPIFEALLQAALGAGP